MEKIALDGLLIVLFILTLNLPFFRVVGHEILGGLLLLALLLHHAWNRSWHDHLKRSRWNYQRRGNALVMALMAASCLTVIFSGIAIARNLLPFSIRAPLAVHEIHWLSGYLFFLFAALHTGMHSGDIKGRLMHFFSLRPSPALDRLFQILTLALVMTGIYFSFQERIGDRLLMTHMVNMLIGPQSLLEFSLAFGNIFILYAIMGHYFQALLRHLDRPKRRVRTT
ncbi:MAG: DUF4405 domain-containing protein [Dialister sp.]|nr:DUF4405 domain-containing protein [Dialister sp.]